jgi:hypothetical protein
VLASRVHEVERRTSGEVDEGSVHGMEGGFCG